MKRIGRFIFCWAAALVTLAAQPFVHPGLLQSRHDLDFMKGKVDAGEQPWKHAWENLLQQPFSAPDFQPKPTAHIVRGSYGRDAIGDRDLSNSANAAYSQALQWYITRDRAHSRKAIEILNAWSAMLWDFEGNDAKLLAAWTGAPFCNAAEILRATDAGWQPQEIERFRRMLLTVYVPLLRDFFSEANGNWDAAIADTLLSIAIFCDDRALFDSATAHVLHGPGNGGITKYLYPSGQCEESTRDQTHTQLGLGYFVLAAQTAWTQGVDLYSAADNRLALGLEYTARYLLGEDVPAYGVISPQGRGRFSDIYEAAYQQYHESQGIDQPFCARAIEQTRQRGWTALTLYRGPGHKPSVGPPQPASQAESAGAADAVTAQPPAGAIRVAPGQSVQDALDRAAAGSGWVALAKGVHNIPAALRMPSGVTLAGEGRDSILWLDPQKPGPAIVAATSDLHDVTFRDFVVEGAVATRTSSDPNQDRRARSYQNALSRGGISLAGNRTGEMRRLRFEHLTVRHCTHNGVAIRGAAEVRIAAVDFSDNGSSVAPGPGLLHNLLLSHVEGAEVLDSRLDDSPWGSGLDAVASSGIVISGCEAARNRLHGVQVAESMGIQIRGNLFEGNDASGLILEKLMDGVRQLETTGNLMRNNGRD